jgi:hypothetical protein
VVDVRDLRLRDDHRIRGHAQDAASDPLPETPVVEPDTTAICGKLLPAANADRRECGGDQAHGGH